MTRAAEALERSNLECATRPRIGFLGLGWIGRHRMQSIAESGIAEICGLADPDPNALGEAAALAPEASVGPDLGSLLDLGLDGLVIATPSAIHTEQALAALDRSLCVFCQKPLGRSSGETLALVEKARLRDRNLGVDLSYRGLRGLERMREIIRGGEVGEIYAADLVFHNGYGPDKPWYYDCSQSGGGCVMDLGVHLVDLALWTLGNPGVREVSSRLFAGGKPWVRESGCVEEFATARIDLENGTVLNLSCSWRVSAGCDAVIGAQFFGTKGGLSLTNLDHSFYRFRTERFRGTSRELLEYGDEAWWGRTAVDWVRRVGKDKRYDPEVETQVTVSRVLDAIYGR